MVGPPDDAYGRVTNPERYAVVQDAARDLIADLTRQFDVQISTGDDVDEALGHRGVEILGHMVRVVPNDPHAAPVTFAFTSFPAVLVHAGQWRISAYPHCGCDACDEAPDDVVEQLRNDLNALTAGGVQERWDGTRLHTAITYSQGSAQSGWTLVEQDRDQFGPPREYVWRPWPRTPTAT